MVWAMKGGGLCGAEGQVAGFGHRNDSGECTRVPLCDGPGVLPTLPVRCGGW